MNGIIQRWGDSTAIRIPKNILDTSLLKENDSVEIIAEENRIILVKTNKKEHIPLKERLKDFNGEYKAEEWDTGKPMGREIF